MWRVGGCPRSLAVGDRGGRQSRWPTADSGNAATLYSCTAAACNSSHQKHFHPAPFQVEKHFFPCIPVRTTGNKHPERQSKREAVGRTAGAGNTHPERQSSREAPAWTASPVHLRTAKPETRQPFPPVNPHSPQSSAPNQQLTRPIHSQPLAVQLLLSQHKLFLGGSPWHISSGCGTQ